MLDFARMMRFLPLDAILIVAFALYAVWLVAVLSRHGMFRGMKNYFAVLANTLGGLTQIDETACPDWADPVKWEESVTR